MSAINHQVAEAQNRQRLQEIMARLDTSGLEKMPDSPICQEYRVSAKKTYISGIQEPGLIRLYFRTLT